MKTALDSIVRRVNAVAEMTDDTDENAQVISDFIIKFNGITEQYRLIIARKKGASNKESDTEEGLEGDETITQTPEEIK